MIEDSIDLCGERVYLVPAERALHMEKALLWFRDLEVTRHLPASACAHFRRLREEDFFESNRRTKYSLWWAVLDEKKMHIGFTSLNPWIGQHVASSVLIIGEKTCWKMGYATDVALVRMRYAFEILGLHRLEAECSVENPGILRVLEKVGYKRKRRHSTGFFCDNGMQQDTIILEISSADYYARYPYRLNNKRKKELPT